VTPQPIPIDDLLGPLNDIERKFAPAFLYAQGRTDLLRTGRRVSIVGSRKATELGLKRAARLARILSERGVTVVSGLAEGIDTAAHRSAIQHRGRTIAVIGTPLNEAYPKSNAELQAQIAHEHLLISQFAPDQPVQKQNFILRNRTMALISDASVIVEAGETSGSLSQGWEALRLGRSLFVLKSLVDNPALSWPTKLLDYGAYVLSEPEDLLALLPSERSFAHEDAPF
jgi:DNA processing protein